MHGVPSDRARWPCRAGRESRPWSRAASPAARAVADSPSNACAQRICQTRPPRPSTAPVAIEPRAIRVARTGRFDVPDVESRRARTLSTQQPSLLCTRARAADSANRNSQFASSTARVDCVTAMASTEPVNGTPLRPAPPPADQAPAVESLASTSPSGGLWLVDYGAGNVQCVKESAGRTTADAAGRWRTR